MVNGQEDSSGKVRADLRNEQLKILLKGWEEKRDKLYDEIASRKGQVILLEDMISQAFEMVIDVNKDEQKREDERIKARLDEIQDEHEAEEEEKRQEEAKKKHEERKKAPVEGRRVHPDDRRTELKDRKKKTRKEK